MINGWRWSDARTTSPKRQLSVTICLHHDLFWVDRQIFEKAILPYLLIHILGITESIVEEARCGKRISHSRMLNVRPELTGFLFVCWSCVPGNVNLGLQKMTSGFIVIIPSTQIPRYLWSVPIFHPKSHRTPHLCHVHFCKTNRISDPKMK
jgi:hypothetical protein